MIGLHVVGALAGVALGVFAVVVGRTLIEGLRRDRRELPVRQAEGLRRDRWDRAVEKLDSEDAVERLECLASLERFGRDSPDAREDVVELICAYLRRPFLLPDDFGEMEPGQAPDEEVLAARRVELDVRRTAQRILSRHFRWPEGEARPFEFWEVDEIELQDAVLVDPDFADSVLSGVDLRDGLIIRGDFRGARFGRYANFDRAAFTEVAHFEQATFGSYTSFNGVRFDSARFDGARFAVGASFGGADFLEQASFEGTVWGGDAVFSAALFGGTTTFAGATFGDEADFSDARVAQPHAGHEWPSPWYVWAASSAPAAQGRLLARDVQA